MPNTILKRWNPTLNGGLGGFEELYPKTVTSQIAASGTASGTTFLRGDGQWAVPAGVDSYVNITGDTMSGQLTSTVATGTAPFVIASTTRVSNLNVATAGTADILTTGRTIGIGTGAAGTATSFNGSANITIPITGVSESYLTWGGKHLSGQVTPIGMSLSNELSANRIAFINGAGLDFEYSADSGTTWTNYNYTATQKSQWCTTALGVTVGRISGEYFTTSRTRVTLTAQNGTTGYVYTNPRKMLINISSSGGMNVLVETRTGVNFQSSGAWSTVGTYSLSGWSGWNDIPLVLGTLGGGTTQTGNNWQLRLTFIMTSKNTTYPTTAQVEGIRIFGENAWQTPSTLAATNDLYSFDMSQNAFFPGTIQGTRLISTIATGTSPLAVTSTTAVANLNADLLDGLHSTAFVPARTRSDWNNATSVIGNVIGELAWKNYGNGHTIFDASNSTAPGGTAKNNTNPDIFWAATYPTLMGWNGTNTYGVRVDSARVADTATTATTATSASNIDGISFRNGNSTNGTNPDNINENGTSYITNVSLFGQTDGALYSQAFSTVWNHHIFGDYRTGSMAVRGRNNGTLTAWRTVWDSGNDGTGSGLDADLLDGNHASAFALASHTHAISDVTGLQTAIDARIPLTQKGAASGVVPLNSSSKIEETYLPNFIFGGMRYISSIGGNTTAESLLDSAQTYIASNGGTVSGCYFIVSGTATVTITGGNDTNNGVTHTFSPGPINMTAEEGDNVFDTIDLEPGDWFVINDTWGPYFSVTYQRWSVVNNTYALVTTSAPGIMSAADKTKLDGIASSANNYTHPTGGANSTISNANGLVLSSITVDTLGHVTSVGSKTLAVADIPTLNQNTTGSAATLTTARTLTIGSTGKTFNGGANVSWTLAEIGAQVAGSYAAASHTHAIADVTSLQTSLDAKAPLASPTLTGTPTAPTATAGTNTTQIATTAFVSTAVANLINSAPGALDTLDELAAALGDDANFASTVTNSLALKANDNAVVKLTGDQTIAGVKTFSSDIYAPRFIANPSSGGNDTSGAWGIADHDDKLSAVRDYITDTYYPIYHTGNKPTATDVGLGNVTNESKATMFTSPTFTGTVSGVTASMVGLGNVTNESKATMFASPTFTGTVSGVTAAMVGAAATSHTHGVVLNNGTITASTVAVQSGDALLMTDVSNSNTIQKSAVVFGTGTTTFLRNDGQWGALTASIALATTSVIGGMEIGFTSTETNRAVSLSGNKGLVALPRQIPVINLNGTAGATTATIWASATSGVSGRFLQSQGSSAPTFVETSTGITASAAVNSSTAATIAVTGYRMILVQMWRNSTNEVYSFWVDLTDTTYNFTTAGRNLRFRWYDGSFGFDNSVIISNNSGLRLQHNAGGTFIFKCTGVR